MKSKGLSALGIALAVIAVIAIIFGAISWSKFGIVVENEQSKGQVSKEQEVTAVQGQQANQVAQQGTQYTLESGISFTYPIGYTAEKNDENDGEVILTKNGEWYIRIIPFTMEGSYESLDELLKANPNVKDGNFAPPEKKGESLNPDLFYIAGIVCSSAGDRIDGMGGNDVSISCADKPVSKKTLNINGYTVYEYYAKRIEEDFSKKTEDATVIGPIYVFDVTKNFTDGYAHALVVTPDGEIFVANKNNPQFQADLLAIAQSVESKK
ncbi:hypothetical protein HY623_03355 [Candidatus Uhrbacteria bacterium]|nr:hypothetical protein [Candidatus Uhrbacteria bacterium]